MINVAILGFGTVGSGVADVLTMNAASIEKKVGQAVNLKYILDVRDFPDSPYQGCFVKDFAVIENDPELGAVIRGTYGTSEYDYDEWSHRYIVELTAEQMRWTAKDDRADVSVYRRVEALPEF